MENEKDWKLKLKYGEITTPYKHFTAIGEGIVGELADGFECAKGPAFMGVKTWAIDEDESAEMLRIIGEQIGFQATGDVQVYNTDPEQQPREKPFGYAINFTPYDE